LPVEKCRAAPVELCRVGSLFDKGLVWKSVVMKGSLGRRIS
jgi:hypothetical protein